MICYRRETELQGGLVMAKSGRLALGGNIYGQYTFIFNHRGVFGQQRNRKQRNKRKIRAITPFKVIQDHRRSSSSVPIGTNRKPVCDFLLVINSNCHPISYRFVDIAAYCSNFGHSVSEPPLGRLRHNSRCSSRAHWKACSGLPVSDN